jgi:hypothetical protein
MLPFSTKVKVVCSNTSFKKVVIDQTGNRRSEDGEVERAPGNRQQKHMFVVSTDMFCKRLQCIYELNLRGLVCSK